MKKRKMLAVASLLIFANIIVMVLLVNMLSEKKRLEEQFADSAVIAEELEEIEILLPETVYAANGITMEVYNAQITSLGDEINRYNVRWNCEIGENLGRRFSVSANDDNLGIYELTMEIYNNQLELVAEKTCELILTEADMSKIEIANRIQQISDIPENCLEQARCSVDIEYNGTLEQLKPEGLTQLRDIVYSVLCGN